MPVSTDQNQQLTNFSGRSAYSAPDLNGLHAANGGRTHLNAPLATRMLKNGSLIDQGVRSRWTPSAANDDLRTTEKWIVSSRGRLELVKEIKPAPILKSGQVECRPLATGLCGSDYRYVDQSDDFPPGCRKRPKDYVVGHETVAQVTSVHPGCKSLQVGDLVVLNPHLDALIPDRPLQSDNLIGSKAYFATPPYSGTLVTSLVHPESRCIKIPPNSRIDHAVLAEPLACAMNAVLKCLSLFTADCYDGKYAGTKINPLSGRTIVVQGAGGQGCMAAILLANINTLLPRYREVLDGRVRELSELHPQLGLTDRDAMCSEMFRRPINGLKVVVAGVREQQVEMLMDLFKDAISQPKNGVQVFPMLSERNLLKNPNDSAVVRAIEKISGGEMAAAVIECSGGGNGIDQAIQRIGNEGKIISIGRSQYDPADQQRKQGDLSFTYRFNDFSMRLGVSLLVNQDLPEIPHLTTEQFDWARTNDAFKMAFDEKESGIAKAVIRYEDFPQHEIEQKYQEIDARRNDQRAQYKSILNDESSAWRTIAKELKDETGIGFVDKDYDTGRIQYTKQFKPLQLRNEAGLPVDLLFIRHGEVHDNREPRTFNGCVDDRPSTQLNEEGLQQAGNAAKQLFALRDTGWSKEQIQQLLNDGWDQDSLNVLSSRGFDPGLVLHSPLSRARETAFAYTTERGMSPSRVVENHELREMEFGDAKYGGWDGRRLINVGEQCVGHLLRSDQNALVKSTPQRRDRHNRSENFAELLMRMKTAIDSLKIPADVKSVVIYGHGMSGAALRALCGRAPQETGVRSNGETYQYIVFDGGSNKMKNATPYPMIVAGVKPTATELD